MLEDSFQLNERAARLAERCENEARRFNLAPHRVAGATVLDFGVEAAGGLAAGRELARICLSNLGDVRIEGGQLAGRVWPQVTVQTDHPLHACLLSQYAGWQIGIGKFFALGSGPMRATAAVEPLFQEFGYREPCDFNGRYVGVLESGRLPNDEVVSWIADKLAVTPSQITLCVARTASLAGTVQVVARSVETALHKLHELKFDVRRIRSGFGTAPLPPVAADDLTGIGLTNDAILYGGSVALWVTGDDESIGAIGPQVPSSASAAHGEPFLKVFEQAGRDFYKIDPMLFSPAEITFCNLTTGKVQRFGELAEDVLRRSFGIEL
ncbi:MAG: methenyltetrahydromethanopterin cyclohydrolase [Planctomycetaceae bacterium]|nr:methenyltetrahydromethanopterin cyclohydrolase [Planctomycetaceae bacterium]